MKINKIMALMSCFLLIFSINSYAVPEEDNKENSGPAVSASNYILINMDNGEVLYEHNSFEKKYPASTTKIMTAILAIENLDLNESSKVSNKAVMSISWDSSKLGLYEGEVLKNYDLLAGMMVASGNDAANVLAEAVSGSIESFVDLMNAKAKELGCTSTHFSNTHGLTDENHYTSVSDMAKIAQYAMKNPLFREIVKITEFELPMTEKCEVRRYFINTNNLLTKSRTDKYFYSPATGIKTGYTDAALNCLVASAEKDGVKLISVVLGASNIDGVNMSYKDTKELFDWGFNNYENYNVISLEEVVVEKSIKYAKGEKTAKLVTMGELGILQKKGEKTEGIKTEIKLDGPLKAPIMNGNIVGTIEVLHNNELIGRVNLTVDKDYEYSWWSAFLYVIGRVVIISILIVLGAIGILIIIRQVEYERRRKERIKNRQRNYK